MDARQGLPTPEQHGWSISDGALQPVLMTKEPAPRGLVELTACRCKKSACRRAACSCRANGLACTEACACMANESCQNQNTMLQDQVDGHNVEDEDDEDDYI